ncbi:MAG: NAD-dependent epimerase/dehydratase family protein [Bacteroidales bacterium]|nr:NAD-dependent epimerase/dehydratase family protein [Bacteroidales bacterium]
MRLLIIGGGAIADCNHIPAAKKILDINDIYLAELDQQQAAKLKAKHGLQHVVGDYREALPFVDACIICTPPHVHNAILKDCIAARKHVLCEKPLSPSSTETKEILANAPADLVLGMCHSYRFMASRIEVHRLVKDGFFGDAPSIRIHEGDPSNWPTVSGYCFRKELVPGGAFYDNGIHSADFLLWCLGTPDVVEYEDDAAGGLESNLKLKMQFGKAQGFMQISRTITQSNTIVVEGNGHKAVLDVYDGSKYTLDGKEVTCQGTGSSQLENFLNAIDGKELVGCTMEEGLAVIELLERCYAQREPKLYERKPVGDLQGKTVFVTGGTGFIGGQLVEQLVLHEGAKVRVLVHTWGKAAYVSRFDVEFVQGDLCDAESMTEATKGCDYIMHLAIPGGKGHDEFVQNNVKAVEALMAAAKTNGIRHIVQMSSVVVHGETVPPDLTADSPLVSYGDTYADGKLAAEKRFWELLDEYRLHGTIIRPTYVWGPYSMWYTIYILQQMKKGEFAWVDDGNGVCNAVYVGNVVDMCVRCCTEPAADHQAFLATDGEQVTWREFFGYYLQAIGKKPGDYPSVPLKDGAFRTMRLNIKNALWKRMVKLMDRYEAMKPTSPKKALWLYKAPRKLLRLTRNVVMKNLPEKDATEMAIYSQTKPIDVQKNKEILGFTPRYSVKEGMKQTLQWMRLSDLYD